MERTDNRQGCEGCWPNRNIQYLLCRLNWLWIYWEQSYLLHIQQRLFTTQLFIFAISPIKCIMIFMLCKTHHHRQVTHVELGNTRHQGLLMLLHNWRDPAQHILVLLSQNTANTQYRWSVRLQLTISFIIYYPLLFGQIKMKYQKIVKKHVHHNFPKPKMMSSDVSFCLAKSPKPKDVQ